MQIKAAELYDQQGNYAEAKKVLEAALADRERAVGATSPMIKAPLIELAHVFEKLGDQNKSRDLAKRAAALSTPAENYDVEADRLQQGIYSLKIKVAKSLKINDYVQANKDMDKLLSCYEHLGGTMHEGQGSRAAVGIFSCALAGCTMTA